MASIQAKAKRGFVANARLSAAVARLAELKGVELVEVLKVRDSDLARIMETENLADFLEALGAMVTESRAIRRARLDES